MRVLVGLVMVSGACAPDICGDIEIRVASNPETQQYDIDGDGDLDLAELCGSSDGAFASERADIKVTTLVLDANTRDGSLEGNGTIGRIVLPAASVVFMSKHLVPGMHMDLTNLAGGGVHKMSEGDSLQTYLLSAGTVDVLAGPDDREEDTFDGETHWSETWKLSWDLTFGSDEHWTGTDWVKRTDGSTVGSLAFTPPDYTPP